MRKRPAPDAPPPRPAAAGSCGAAPRSSMLKFITAWQVRGCMKRRLARLWGKRGETGGHNAVCKQPARAGHLRPPSEPAGASGRPTQSASSCLFMPQPLSSMATKPRALLGLLPDTTRLTVMRRGWGALRRVARRLLSMNSARAYTKGWRPCVADTVIK